MAQAFQALSINENAIVRVGTALTAGTVLAIERRMIMHATAAMIAQRTGMALIKPRIYKFIPLVGWAIAIGSTLYAGYEAYKSTVINYNKLENGVYDAQDMETFRIGYTEANLRFADTSTGVRARSQRRKYILIPAEVMPVIAAVDTVGIEHYGNILTWDPSGGPARRAAATNGRGSAGPFTYTNGNVVRGSWEEYPFAVTRGPRPGAHVDRVPLRENWIQGGFIRAAAMVQQFRPEDTVYVYILA
jgi:hypothetical protein